MNPDRIGGVLLFSAFWAVQAVLILLRLALLGLSAYRAIKAIATTCTISRRAYVATSDQPKPKPPSNTPMLLVTAHVRGHRASRFPLPLGTALQRRPLTRRATRPQTAGTCRGGRPRSTPPRALSQGLPRTPARSGAAVSHTRRTVPTISGRWPVAGAAGRCPGAAPQSVGAGAKRAR